jgi:hypothetical protein
MPNNYAKLTIVDQNSLKKSILLTKIKNMSMFRLFTLLSLLVLLTASGADAKGDKRSKVIDFEDEVVEGMNKRPLDSLSTLGDGGKKRRKPHLYRKRVGFRTETQETLKALRYTP